MSSTNSSGEDPQQLLDAAVEHHQAGRLNEAESQYERFLRDHPGHPGVLNILGMLNFQREHWGKAIELLEQSVAGAPVEASFSCNLGNALRAAGELGAAIDVFRETLEITPDFHDARIGLGNTQRALGLNSDAIETYRKLLSQFPDRADLHNSLGIACKNANQFEAAISAYEAALEREPGYVDALANRANALLLAERWSESIDAYLQVLSVEPRNSNAVKKIIEINGRIGNFAAIVDFLSSRIATEPGNANYHNNLGVAHYELQQFDQALESLAVAVELSPDYADAHYNIARCLHKQRRFAEAVAAYQTTLQIDPRYEKAYDVLSRLYQSRGSKALATRQFRRWLEACPGHPVAIHLLAASSGETQPERASDAFIQRHFDEFSRTFDQQLSRLGYDGAGLVRQAVSTLYGEPAARLAILDAGCGTGLSATVLKPFARHLTGIDLSAGMLQKARELNVYDELVHAELTAYLTGCTASFDLIVIADTLIYFGALGDVFTGASRTLVSGGNIIFTVEKIVGNSAGFELDSSGRYRHDEAYLRTILEQAGLKLNYCEDVSLRKEYGKDTIGLLAWAHQP